MQSNGPFRLTIERQTLRFAYDFAIPATLLRSSVTLFRSVAQDERGVEVDWEFPCSRAFAGDRKIPYLCPRKTPANDGVA